MKLYVKPQLFCIEIRAEEKLAATCDQPGFCKTPSKDFNGNGTPDYFSES